jgi:hypothetical protein
MVSQLSLVWRWQAEVYVTMAGIISRATGVNRWNSLINVKTHSDARVVQQCRILK